MNTEVMAVSEDTMAFIASKSVRSLATKSASLGFRLTHENAFNLISPGRRLLLYNYFSIMSIIKTSDRLITFERRIEEGFNALW
jgi:hypothetical protein